MYKLVLIRHGESTWNKENRFTGWHDVELTDKGRSQAQQAGKLLLEQGYRFDEAFTSVLTRAIRTLSIVLDEMQQLYVPVHRYWRLNERHYGALQGLNKAETTAEHGEEQVLVWRRSFDIPPPALNKDDERYPGHDLRYQGLDQRVLPLGESLKDTIERVLPCWHDQIVPSIKAGKRIIIAAHGNSLRALVKYLDDLTEDEVLKLNIPTGVPLLYELDENLIATKREFLGNQDEIEKMVSAVADQAKAK